MTLQKPGSHTRIAAGPLCIAETSHVRPACRLRRACPAIGALACTLCHVGTQAHKLRAAGILSGGEERLAAIGHACVVGPLQQGTSVAEERASTAGVATRGSKRVGIRVEQ